MRNVLRKKFSHKLLILKQVFVSENYSLLFISSVKKINASFPKKRRTYKLLSNILWFIIFHPCSLFFASVIYIWKRKLFNGWWCFSFFFRLFLPITICVMPSAFLDFEAPYISEHICWSVLVSWKSVKQGHNWPRLNFLTPGNILPRSWIAKIS